MLISNAYAASGIVSGGAGNLLIQLGLIVLIFYVLIIRPQQKQMKLHREMINKLKKGDKILTSSGIYATIVKADDPLDLVVEISNGVDVVIDRNSVKGFIPLEGANTAKNIAAGKVDKKAPKQKPANSNKK